MIRREVGGIVTRSRRLASAIVVAALAAGCTDFAGYDLDYILGAVPVIGTMRSTPAWEAQTMPRDPVPGTVPAVSPAGDAPAPFAQADLDAVAAALVNPLPASEEVLARGATVYTNQCFVCHGAQGEGNGPVVGAGRFPMGPSLVTAAAAARTDGYIYGVVRVGRGLMPAYGDRVPDRDRWAVVHYVRSLQQQAGLISAPAAAPAAPATPEPTPAAPGA